MATPLALATALQSVDADQLPTSVRSGRVDGIFTSVRKLYGEKKHRCGVTYTEHVLGVLRVLLPFEPDEDTVAACLLQHGLALKAITLSDIEVEYGESVRNLVSALHLLSHVTTQSKRSSIDELRLMLVSMADDARVLPVILAERVFLLESCPLLPPAERKRICRDVLGLFAPVAARLGMHAFKQKLESLAFPVLYASDALRIAEQLTLIHNRYGMFLQSAATDLQKALLKQGIAARVDAREKLPYSIFAKMRNKSVSSIEQLPDLFALRVIVDSVSECYQVLGLVHHIGRPVANRFKDYIGFQKPNGYKSLHTTMARFPGIPEGLFVELQIRTMTMHREAEYGFAAHWSYKETGAAELALQKVKIQQALTSQELMSSTSELVDHIYVLTPKGDIVELPEGATPLDFAFQVHTDLGLSFRAARVNGRIVSIDDELENGDIVEILTHSTPRPSTDWLQLLKMSSSKSRLRHYLADIHRDDLLERGREMFNEELKTRRMPELDQGLLLLKEVGGKKLDMEEREGLLVKVGQGSDKVGAILSKTDKLKELKKDLLTQLKKPRLQRKDALLEIDGGLQMPLRYAKCCKPQDKRTEAITGVITRTGDIVVHLQKCRQLRRGNPERRVGVRWK